MRYIYTQNEEPTMEKLMEVAKRYGVSKKELRGLIKEAVEDNLTMDALAEMIENDNKPVKYEDSFPFRRIG